MRDRPAIGISACLLVSERSIGLRVDDGDRAVSAGEPQRRVPRARDAPSPTRRRRRGGHAGIPLRRRCPSHCGSSARSSTSAENGPGEPSVIITASRACRRAWTRRARTALSRCGTSVMTTSNPSNVAATSSAHDSRLARSGPASTPTTRSRGMPNSSAASNPNVGTPTTASQDPEAVAATASDTARDIAAAPPHATALPRTNPPSGNSGESGSTTGSSRSLASDAVATGSARRSSVVRCGDVDVIPVPYRTGVRHSTGMATRLDDVWHGESTCSAAPDTTNRPYVAVERSVTATAFKPQ